MIRPTKDPNQQSEMRVRLLPEVLETYDVFCGEERLSYTRFTRIAMAFYLKAYEARVLSGNVWAIRNAIDRTVIPPLELNKPFAVGATTLRILINQEYEQTLADLQMVENKTDEQVVNESVLFMGQIVTRVGQGYEKIVQEIDGRDAQTIFDIHDEHLGWPQPPISS